MTDEATCHIYGDVMPELTAKRPQLAALLKTLMEACLAGELRREQLENENERLSLKHSFLDALSASEEPPAGLRDAISFSEGFCAEGAWRWFLEALGAEAQPQGAEPRSPSPVAAMATTCGATGFGFECELQAGHAGYHETKVRGFVVLWARFSSTTPG